MAKYQCCKVSIFLIMLMVVWVGCDDKQDPKSPPAAAQELKIELDSDGSVILTTAVIDGASAYVWMIDGQAIASTVAPKFFPDLSGCYSVAGVNSSGVGLSSESIFVDLSGVPEAPVLSTRTSDDGMLIIEASSLGAIGYRWFLDDELLQRGTSGHFIPPTSGEYKVEAYNACGTSLPELISVTVEVVNLLDPEVVPDPDFRSFIALKLADNQNFYSSVEAAKVVELNLRGTGVADITGIRYFSGLKRLLMQYCSNILVMDLHHNQELEVLDLYNTQKLRSVDISGLAKIREININDSNLGSIDLTDCIESLESLNAGFESFKSLDMQGAKNLRYLNLGSNSDLTSLNVSGLPNLEELIVSATKLTELDLSGCKSLSSLTCAWSPIENLRIDPIAPLKVLKVARCSSKVFANINLSDYSNSLEILYADDAGITTDLDFSNCVMLKEVQLDRNGFRRVNFNGCSSLVSLRVAENDVLEECSLLGCSELSIIYCYQTAVKSLDFSDSPELGMAILFENSELSTVNFSGCSNLYWISAEFTSLGPDIDISASKILESVDFRESKVRRVKINSSYDLMHLPFAGKLPSGATFVHSFD